jgi:exoribonuclease R
MFRICPIYPVVFLVLVCGLSSMAADQHQGLMYAYAPSLHYDGSWTADIYVERQLFYDDAGNLRTPQTLISFLNDSCQSIAYKDNKSVLRYPKDLVLSFEWDKPAALKGGLLQKLGLIKQFTEEEIDLLCDAAEQSETIAGIWINGYDLTTHMFKRFARLKFALGQRNFQMSLGVGLRDYYSDELEDEFKKLVPNAQKSSLQISVAAIETTKVITPSLARASEIPRTNSCSSTITLKPAHLHSVPNPTDEIIKKYKMPSEFSALMKEVAAKITLPKYYGEREDLRTIPLITVDGEDAKDFDDAVFAEPDTKPRNEGGYRIIVAIADVSYFVQHRDLLDRVAAERGNSVYFPDRVLPMLPEIISNKWCSLMPHEDRLVLAVEMFITKEGVLVKWPRFFRAVMRSHARLTYKEIQQAYDTPKISKIPQNIRSLIPHLYGAYKVLKSARNRRGSLEINIPTKKIVFTADGAVARTVTEPHYESHWLIEEFMVLANVAAAQFLERNGKLLLYRVHPKPKAEKITELEKWLKDKYLKGEKFALLDQRALTKIMDIFFDSKYEKEVAEKVLFAQSPASYSTCNASHWGLNLQSYCHFTSPIRRYADLLVHRAIISVLENNSALYPYDAQSLAKIGQYITGKEREADRAGRELMGQIEKSF